MPYKMSWVKYTQSRSMSYSHKSVVALLGRHGFDVTVTPPATMIAWTIVQDEQARDQVSALLKRIDRKLGARIEMIGDQT